MFQILDPWMAELMGLGKTQSSLVPKQAANVSKILSDFNLRNSAKIPILLLGCGIVGKT